jgi:hypothetical protein
VYLEESIHDNNKNHFGSSLVNQNTFITLLMYPQLWIKNLSCFKSEMENEVTNCKNVFYKYNDLVIPYSPSLSRTFLLSFLKKLLDILYRDSKFKDG